MGLKTLQSEVKCDIPGCGHTEVYSFCEQSPGWSQLQLNCDTYLLCKKCASKFKKFLDSSFSIPDRLDEIEDKVSVLLISLGDVEGNSLNLPLERQLHAKQAIASLKTIMGEDQ